jgi:glucosamine--fructose-6-phosphate aminotransferase (isomerizing)
MLSEARQVPDAVARHLASSAGTFAALGAALRERPPRGVLTVARGSSDHAAHYMAYLVMARLGQLVTSLPMSLVTLYAAQLQSQGLLSVAFSQSGQSPDLVAPTRQIAADGGTAIAIVNDEASPLAQAADWVLPLAAGPEISIAATKSYVTQLVAGARLVAHWQNDPALLQALDALPAHLASALAQDWTPMAQALQGADKLYVIGRGTGLAVAMEAALKLKEVCGMQAEALSGAELRHGPMALVGQGYPLLIFAPRGPAQAGLLDLAADMRARGARVILAAPAGQPGADLTIAPAGHQDLDPICAITSFYPAVEALARLRGLEPDAPPHLAKVTCTQ